LIFVLATGEKIPAEEITAEQIPQAIALIRKVDGVTSFEVVRRVAKRSK
jgi:hypothetical protein